MPFHFSSNMQSRILKNECKLKLIMETLLSSSTRKRPTTERTLFIWQKQTTLMGLFFIVWFRILSFKAEIQIKRAHQIKDDELANTYSHPIPETDCDITEVQSRCRVAKLKTRIASPYEFFIVQQMPGAYHLDGKYTVFGYVVEGMEIVDKINRVPIDKREWPIDNVRMKVRVFD